jgi:acetylglutamate kinase
MIPKVKAALAVLAAGVSQARIVDIQGLEDLAVGSNAGTLIVMGGAA